MVDSRSSTSSPEASSARDPQPRVNRNPETSVPVSLASRGEGSNSVKPLRNSQRSVSSS